MLRHIKVKKNFKQIVDTPLVTGDTKAYEIVWDVGEEARGATLQIIAKRNDLSTICDTCKIGNDGIARYVLKNNMYAISGSMRLMLSVVSEESILTERVLCFNVMLGSDAATEPGEDVFPAFTKVVIEVEKLKKHEENRKNPHNVTKEQLGLGYIENAFSQIMTNKASGENELTLTDSNEYLKINSIGILGNSEQKGEPTLESPSEVVCVENPEITAEGISAKLNIKLYGIKNSDGTFIARDRIFAENGKMYIRREVKIVNKLSDFNFATVSHGEQTNLFRNTITCSSKSGTYGFCNRLPYSYVYNSQTATGIMASTNLMYLRLPANEFPDAQTVNAKIKEIFDSGETFEVYYAEKEPLTEEIKDTSLLEMTKLKGNITASVKANIEAGIEIGYNQKLNGVIEEIKNAIIAMGGEI